MNDEINQNTEELSRALQALTGNSRITAETLVRLGAAIGNTTKLAEAQAAAEKIREQRATNYANALQSLIGATVGFTNALTSAEKGLSKYGRTLNSVGDAALKVGENFGGLGKAAMYGVKAVTMMGDQVLAQTDRMSKGFDAIAQVGATSTITAGKMRNMANEAGLSTFQLEAMGKAAADASAGFVSAGGSVGSGMEKFGKIITNNMYQFRQLGFSVEEVMAMNTAYLKQTANSGVSLNRPIESLRKSSEEYVKNLVILADLTGADIKTQQQSIDFANADANYKASNLALSMKEQKLREQAAKQTGEQQRQTLAQADAIAKETEERKKFVAGLGSEFSKEEMTGFLQAIASGGTFTSQQMAALQNRGVDPNEFARALKAGEDGAVVLARLIDRNAQSYKQNAGYLEQSAKLGEGGLEMMKARSMSEKSMDSAARHLTGSAEEQLKASKAGVQAQLNGRDAVAKGIADLEQFERNMQMKLDSVVDAFNPFTAGLTSSALAFTGLAAAATAAAYALGKIAGGTAADEIGAATGRRPGAYGRYARRYGGRIARGVGIGAGLAIGGNIAGDAIGGTGGALLSTAGDVAGGAVTGAEFGGVYGAVIGGVVGLGMGLMRNSKALFGNTEATQDSDKLTEQLMKKYDANTEATNKNTAATTDASKPKVAGQPGAPGEPKYDQAEMDKLQKMKADLVTRQNVGTQQEKQANRDALKAVNEKIKGQEDLRKKEEQQFKDDKKFVDDKARAARAKQALTEAQQRASGEPPRPAAGAGVGAGGGAPAARPAPSAAPAAAPASRPAAAAPASAAPAAPAGGGGGGGGGMPEKQPTPTVAKPSRTGGGGGGAVNMDLLRKGIIAHEGNYPYPYKDIKGLWTIGVGHLIGDGKSLPPEYAAWANNGPAYGRGSQNNNTTPAWTKEQVMSQLDSDIQMAVQGASKNTTNFNAMTSDGKTIFSDLAFNMGGAWNKPPRWPKLNRELAAKNNPGVQRELIDSDWYKQVGRRSQEITGLAANTFPQARDGGIANGPESGFPAMLHGKEMITKFRPDTMLEKLASTPMSAVQNESSITVSKMESVMKNFAEMNQKSMSEWVGKLNKVIEVLENSHNTQEKLLRVTRS